MQSKNKKRLIPHGLRQAQSDKMIKLIKLHFDPSKN